MSSDGDGEATAVPYLTRYMRGLLAAGFLGASVTLGFWALLHQGDILSYVTANRLDTLQRQRLVIAIVLGLVGAASLFGLVCRRKGVDAGERMLRIAMPLAVLGPTGFLVEEKAWEGREISFLVLVFLGALLLSATLHPAFLAIRGSRLDVFAALQSRAELALGWARQRQASRISFSLILATLLGVGYAVFFGVATSTAHYNFCTSAYDLGIEHNLVWGAAHGEPLFRSAPLGGNMRHGGFHQTYFAYVIAPIYRLIPRAETLLWLQALALGAATLPLYLYAKLRLGEKWALGLCALYVFYGPLHGANLYDFHYQPFGVPLIFLIAYLLEREHYRALVPVVLLTFSVREDMGALVSATGAFYLFSGRRVRAALALAVFGGAYFVALKLYIMPVFFMRGESSFAFMFKDLVPEGERGFGAVLKTVVGNPGYALDTLLTRDKVYYLLQIFVPVAMLPLRRSWALILFAPAAVFTLLATGYPALIMTSFQYTCYWVPMVFVSLIHVLDLRGREVPTEKKVTTFLVLAYAMLLTSNRFGVFFQQDLARGAFDPVRLSSVQEDHQNQTDFQSVLKQLPTDSRVVAAEWLISHVAGRRNAYTLRLGLRDAEYILFWTHPQKLRPDEKPILRGALLGNKAEFGLIASQGMFHLAKRGAPTEGNRSLRGKI